MIHRVTLVETFFPFIKYVFSISILSNIFRASMTEEFLPPAYIYMNGFIIAVGMWSLICQESVDAIMMVRNYLHTRSLESMHLKSLEPIHSIESESHSRINAYHRLV